MRSLEVHLSCLLRLVLLRWRYLPLGCWCTIRIIFGCGRTLHIFFGGRGDVGHGREDLAVLHGGQSKAGVEEKKKKKMLSKNPKERWKPLQVYGR